jgi:hypothetical protein
LDDKTQNLANTTFAEIDNSVDVDDRVEKTDLLTKLSNGFKEAMSILSSQPVGGGPASGAIGASELVETDAGKEVGKSIVSGAIKGTVDAANMAKDVADFTGKMINPMGNQMLQKKYKEEFGINLDNTDVVDMVMPIFGLTTNDFENALKEIEPDTIYGQVGSELTAFLVASSLMPGGALSTGKKAFLKGALGDAAITPRTGNLATLAAELGVENEFVDFLDSYMENPSETSTFERLKARVKGATTDSVLIGTAFLAATKILASKIGQIGLGGAAVTASTTEEGEAGVPGLLAKYGFRTLGKNNQIVGAPPGMNTVKKLRNLETKLTSLAREGEIGRFWYEDSSKTILEAVGGDVDEADKLIQAIAITSPQTPVNSNFGFALQAYNQFKAGEPIRTGMFPTAMSKRLEKVFSGEDWGGRKTNDFYNNLMIHIDPDRVGPVTGDIWMLRAFGFTNPNEMPSEKQYEFITKVTQQIAKDLGWEPHQVQASIWVNYKARSENKQVRALAEKISTKKGYMKYENGQRVILNPQKHMETWLRQADKYKPTEAEFAKAGFNYADALKGNLGQISWESIPGRTSNHFPEMFNAPYEQQTEYHVAISKAFLDDDGNDILAKELGLLSPGDFEAPGYFEGKVSPGTQTEVVVPKMYKGPKYGEIEPAAVELINAYSIARGILMKQDGVGWHRPFFNPAKKDANGIELRIGREFTEEEIDNFAVILKELSGHGEYNPISSPEGIRILNFDYLEFDNKSFISLVENAIDKVDIKNIEKADVKYFNSQNGYVGNDWSVSKNGEDYIKELGGEGRSDVYRKVYDLIQKIQTRIDEVDDDFSTRYGWTKNETINSQYREIAENTENMTIQ